LRPLPVLSAVEGFDSIAQVRPIIERQSLYKGITNERFQIIN